MFWQGQIFGMARHAPTPKTKNIVGVLRAKPSFAINLKYTRNAKLNIDVLDRLDFWHTIALSVNSERSIIMVELID